jgi:HSP20 family protein
MRNAASERGMLQGGVEVRYRYISYKYSRKVSPDTALQNIWETFGAWAVPVASGWRPPTDVFETPDQFIVLLELGGVTEEDISVTLFSDLLVIEGVRAQPAFFQAGMSACHQLGIKYGEFRSEVYVPVVVDHDNVTAEYKNGLLKIVLRKLD